MSKRLRKIVGKIAPIGADTFVLVGKAGNGSWYLVEAGRDCSLGLHAKRLSNEGLNESSDVSEIAAGDGGAQVLVHNAGCLQWATLMKLSVVLDVTLLLDEDGLKLEKTIQDIWVLRDVTGAIEGESTVSTIDCQPTEEGS